MNTHDIIRGPQNHAPPGYRLLLQVFDLPLPEAKELIMYTFGPTAALQAVYVAGAYIKDRKTWNNSASPWIWKPDGGYMVFVPK